MNLSSPKSAGESLALLRYLPLQCSPANSNIGGGFTLVASEKNAGTNPMSRSKTKSQIASLSCCECGEPLLYYTVENMTAAGNLVLRCYLCMHSVVDVSEAIGCRHLPTSQELYRESSKEKSLEFWKAQRHRKQKWRSAIIQFRKKRLGI